MSQDQPQRRPQVDPVKYGDIFYVSGEIASKTVAPRDAAAMQAAEFAVFGEIQKGGPAAVMQSAADVNVSLGVVGHDDITDKARDEGVTISQCVVADRRVIAEAIGGEVVGGYVEEPQGEGTQGGEGGRQEYPEAGEFGITIGEALEAAALGGSGDKPIDASDAAAIQAAEVRATGKGEAIPGGVGAEAQAAAMINPRLKDEDKTKLGDILVDASERLPCDKEVTIEDALGVAAAEVRNDPDINSHEAGVARTMFAAARLNQP